MGQGRSSTYASYHSGKVYPNTTRFDGLDPGPVHFNDGADAEGKYLKAMTLYFRQHKHGTLSLVRGITPTLAGIKAEYCDQNKEMTVVEHGDTNPKGKRQVDKFCLHAEERNTWMQDDKIVSVNVRCNLQIDQLEFRTRDGRVYGPYGGMCGSQHIECAQDHGIQFQYLSHISGSEVESKGGWNIIRLQFHWK